MIQRYSQVTPEQERLERQRQLPFHLHINLELLECVYLTCSMLLEIPLLAQIGSSPDVKKRVISKTYRRMLEYHERQIFTGPPENTRDHVMQASKALAAGEWKKATEFIHAIKIWELMPDTESIKEMLAKLEESYKQAAQGLKQQAEELRATKEELVHAQEDGRRVRDEWRREKEDKHHMAKSVRMLEEKVARLETAKPPACEHKCEPFGPENHGMLLSVVNEIVQATMNQRLGPVCLASLLYTSHRRLTCVHSTLPRRSRVQ